MDMSDACVRLTKDREDRAVGLAKGLLLLPLLLLQQLDSKPVDQEEEEKPTAAGTILDCVDLQRKREVPMRAPRRIMIYSFLLIK